MKILKNKQLIVIVVFLFIFIGLIFHNIHLQMVPFYDWDEGIYAQIAKEIISNKSLFTTFNGQIWLDKPPLIHALVAGTFLLFGQSEFWARMAMTILSFALLILTYKAAKIIYLLTSQEKNNLTEELFASLIPMLLLAASSIFIDRAALLNSDTIIAVGWMGYLIYQDNYWLKLFFLMIGVWSKSVLGFYPLFIETALTLVKKIINIKQPQEKFQFKTLLTSGLKYFVFLLIPSLWYIVGILKFGQSFIYNHFESQVLKRISVPIELHIGNKYYYISYLWEKMGLINLIFIIGHVIFFINMGLLLLKEKTKFFSKKNILLISLICTPIPFLIFLTFMKTKIYWYVIMFFPFICLSTVYIFNFLNKKIFRYIFFIGVVIYFLFSFSAQTFFSKSGNESTERIDLGKCIAKTSYGKIAFLVDEDERKIQNVLEAAHYDTTSSFYYGGSPSFIYYVQKKVDYYYKISDFVQKSQNYSLLIIAKKDIQNNIVSSAIYLNKKPICDAKSWLTIVQ